MDFNENDVVVIPSAGLGMIIGEVEIDGVVYYDIKCRHANVKKSKYLPHNLRYPCSFEEIEQVFKILRATRTKTKARNNNQLYKAYAEKLNSGEILELAELVRELYTKDAGELSSKRSEYYDKALEQLTDEIVYVLQVGHQGARGVIESIVDRQLLPPEWTKKLKTS